MKISVVVPLFNEAAVLPTFHGRLAAVMAALPHDWDVTYVDDGSTDGTPAALAALRADRRVAVLRLTRNFGKEIALTAGLDHATGDAMVVIDADLQDPPELIPDLVAAWRDGFDIAYARRLSRDGDGWAKRLTARAFYRLIGHVRRVEIPADVGDFRLMSRRATDAVLRLREQHRFMKGLFAWVGYPAKAVPYHRGPRAAGRTTWNYWRLWNFALEGITGFTTLPLRLASYLGFAVALVAVVYACVVIAKTLVFGNSVAGYPSLMVVLLFLGGAQLMTLGIIGEYLGRVFNETKQRPLYLVESHSPAGAAPSTMLRMVPLPHAFGAGEDVIGPPPALPGEVSAEPTEGAEPRPTPVAVGSEVSRP